MKRVMRTDYPVAALSHPGMKGKNNEDCYGVSAFRRGSFDPQPVLLAVLCDGIGGHRAGEVAAELAVEGISREVGKSDGEDPEEILRAAIQAASNTIYTRSLAATQQAGMGSTCACVWLIADRLYIASVGDSRIYLLRGGAIQQLSTDHTWVQEAVELGILKPEQVNGHPNQHVIRRYLGAPTPPEVDLRLRLSAKESDDQAAANQGLRLLPGDIVLLTSDGLTDLVGDGEIERIYREKEGTDAGPAGKAQLESAGSALIELANQRGGHDNITLVAISIPPLPAAARARRGGWLRRNWAWAAGGCAGLLVTGLIAAGIAGGWWWNNRFLAGPATPTLIVAAAEVTPTPTGPAQAITPAEGKPAETFLTPTATPAALFPLESGPTLTPWPTNSPGQE